HPPEHLYILAGAAKNASQTDAHGATPATERWNSRDRTGRTKGIMRLDPILTGPAIGILALGVHPPTNSSHSCFLSCSVVDYLRAFLGGKIEKKCVSFFHAATHAHETNRHKTNSNHILRPIRLKGCRFRKTQRN